MGVKFFVTLSIWYKCLIFASIKKKFKVIFLLLKTKLKQMHFKIHFFYSKHLIFGYVIFEVSFIFEVNIIFEVVFIFEVFFILSLSISFYYLLYLWNMCILYTNIQFHYCSGPYIKLTRSRMYAHTHARMHTHIHT